MQDDISARANSSLCDFMDMFNTDSATFLDSRPFVLLSVDGFRGFRWRVLHVSSLLLLFIWMICTVLVVARFFCGSGELSL